MCHRDPHFAGITYSGLWIQDEIPSEEFASNLVFVGATEVEVYQGQSFSIGKLKNITATPTPLLPSPNIPSPYNIPPGLALTLTPPTEIAVLHGNGEVMEGDTGRMLDAKVGLLAPRMLLDISSCIRGGPITANHH